MDGPDATFFNEVLAVAIRRFGNKVITLRMIDVMQMSLATVQAVYCEGVPSVKPGAAPDPRHVPPMQEAGHKALPMAEDRQP
jgi:hypothetical protein